MLHIIWSIVGFVVGLIASAIMHTHMGSVETTLLDIVGFVIGGLGRDGCRRPGPGDPDCGRRR